MELIKFILWLTIGALVGWFANQVAASEYGWDHKPVAVKVSKSDKG
jgi:hypothetical protein